MIFNWSLYLFEIWSTPAALFIQKKLRNTIPQLGGGGVKIQFRKVSPFIHVMTSFLAMISGLLDSLYSEYSPKLLVVPVLFLGFLLVAHPKQLQSVGTPGAHPCCWSSQISCHFNISKNWSHFYFGRMIHTSYGKTSKIFNSPIWHRPLSFLILLKKISKTIKTHLHWVSNWACFGLKHNCRLQTTGLFEIRIDRHINICLRSTIR